MKRLLAAQPVSSAAIGVGMAIGAVAGMALDNLALGMLLGVAAGTGASETIERRRRGGEEG